MSRLPTTALSLAALLLFGCLGAARGEDRRDAAPAAAYRGPSYSVALLKFANKTPAQVPGMGEAATDILRTQLKGAGLEPIDVGEEALRAQDEIIKLQQTGALKEGRKNAAEGFQSVDFRVQGAITAYSEVEEGSDMLLYQSKTQVARVAVDYSLVDIATGKSLLAESGVGEWRKESGGVLGFGSRSSADLGLRDGALRDALSKALAKMIAKLNATPFQCRILLVEQGMVLLKAGEKSRLPVGTKCAVYREGQEIIDPESGRSLGKREKLVGEVVLVNHQNERLSEAQITSGSALQAGDLVRLAK